MQATAVASVPALDQPLRLLQADFEHLAVRDALVVAQPVHHYLAHHDAQAVLLGGGEADVEALLEDRSVEHGGGRAGAGKRAKCGRCEPLGGCRVVRALEREDVALQPAQQIQPGATAGVGQLGQVRVQVDQPGQQQPRPQIDHVAFGGRSC